MHVMFVHMQYLLDKCALLGIDKKKQICGQNDRFVMVLAFFPVKYYSSDYG